MNLVLKTTLFVVKNSKKVKINTKKVKILAKKLAPKIKIPKWPKNLHFQSKKPEELLTYLFVLDSLNFCFWPKKWKIKYKNKIFSGYFALSLKLKEFFETKKEVNFQSLAKINFSEFKKFFWELPLLEQRYKILKKVSEKMAKKYSSPIKFVLLAKNSAKKLLQKIYTELPYFDDFSFYKGKKIYFLKRAQILIADIFGAFDGKGLGYFKDMDYLTCFADYKLPQILHHYGVLEYSKDLEEKIKNKKLIKKGSRKEIEIRANTIWAIEYLKEELKKIGLKIRSFELDWYLWEKSQKIKLKFPHHRTKTIFY